MVVRALFVYALILTALVSAGTASAAPRDHADGKRARAAEVADVHYRTIKVDGVEVFFREAGDPRRPTVLLLHGFPTSSHMFRELIPQLAKRYHVVAPDYPGFGRSDQPPMEAFDYTFDNLARVVEGLLEKLAIERYSLYLMDYGAPIGFRIAEHNPERVEALIIQNGNAYEEGLREFWDPIRDYWRDPSPDNAAVLADFITLAGVRWQYTHGVRDVSRISPDSWEVDLRHLSRDGNPEIQLALFFDYQNNLPLYPVWHTYLRKYQPPTLIVWGQNDLIFPAEGAFPYKRDLEELEFHLLDTGHFALEEDGARIARLINRFLARALR